MASPFHVLRKRQKEILVVVAVIAIFTFTVGDFILQYLPMGGGGRAEAEAAVTWKGGELNENELFNLRRIHHLTLGYLESVVAETEKRGGSPKGDGVSRDQMGRITAPGIARDDSDERLVRTLLLAEQAEKIGMEVPDEAIYEFLAKLSDRMLSSDELAAFLADSTGRRLTRDQLFDHLRRELLARNYLRLVISGDVMTPDDAWSYYNRLMRRVTTSVIAFPADKYLDKAPRPSKAEVEALYEKYKEQYPIPASPEPGFKERPKYKFAYFKADYDKVLEEEKAKITAEAVQKHYEDNKESYKIPELPEAKSDEKPEGDSAPATSESPEESGESKAPDLTPPENATPPTPELESPKDATPQEPKAKSDNENAPSDEKAPGSNEGASLSPSEFQVAFLAGQEETTNSDSKEAPANSDYPQPKDESDAPQPAAEATETPPADPEKAEPPADESAKDQPADDASKKEAADDGEKKEPAEEGAAKEPKYRPLEEVEDDIRRTLASKAASDRVSETLREAQRHIDKYKRAFASYRARVEAGSEAKPPAEPDYQQIAADLGLEFGETPLVDELTVGETELGKANFGNFFQPISFAQIAMRGDQATLYQAEQIQEYVYWPVEFKESRTPPLDEVEDEVVRAWRLQKAFEIAMQEAEKIAQKVRKTAEGTPLAEAAGVKETEVIQPPAFSWMTQGSTPFGGGAPFISEVAGVDAPGDDFMEAVFALQPGEVGVAPNEPKSIAYLVRVENETPGDEDRRDSFWQTGVQFNFNLFYVAQREQQRKVLAWLDEFEKEWALEWKRPPKTYAG
jgi:hypothetical protein